MKWAEVVAFALANGMRLKRKEDSRLMRLIAFLVWPVNPSFMGGYYTTIRGTFYIPASDWGRNGAIDEDTLRHEAQHARDSRRWPVLFELSYVFGNLGIVVGPGMRAFWEWRGYRLNVEAMAKRGQSVEEAIDYVVPQFIYQWYGWAGGLPCWPFRGYWERKVRRTYQRAALPSPPGPI